MSRKRSPWFAFAFASATIIAALVGFISNLGGARYFLCSVGIGIGCSDPESIHARTEESFPTPDRSAWTPLENNSSYARNYQRRELRSSERFNQVVTVFETPMTDDRRIGVEVSPGEYLEVFKISHDSVIVQIRRDHERYWLLSRQTFALSGRLAAQNPDAGSDVFQVFRFEFQDEIDETRHLLASEF